MSLELSLCCRIEQALMPVSFGGATMLPKTAAWLSKHPRVRRRVMRNTRILMRSDGMCKCVDPVDRTLYLVLPGITSPMRAFLYKDGPSMKTMFKPDELELVDNSIVSRLDDVISDTNEVRRLT